jgi:hypothetical protein
VKIYVAAAATVETLLRKNERQDETQFTTKIDGFPYFFFLQLVLNLTLCMTKLKLKVLVLSFSSLHG